MVPPSLLFKHCYGDYAIAAFNIWSLEQIHALFRAAQRSNAPFIIQVGPAVLSYAHRDMLLSMIIKASEIYPGTIYAIHLDHGTKEVGLEAIAAGGFSSVMIDASHETFETNVSITREIVKAASKRSVEVEAELGLLSGVEEESVASTQSIYTDPEEAAIFVSRTGCHSLAVAVGTSHGAYKFSGEQSLKFDILEQIQKRLPGFPLVLHGASSIDPNEIRRINALGGTIGSDARGIPSAEIKKAITYGVCKINIATDSRILWTRIHREYFRENPDQIDQLVPGNTYMKELEELYISKFEALNARGKSEEISL
jgi:fructose-bisphosphate aldolase class II